MSAPGLPSRQLIEPTVVVGRMAAVLTAGAALPVALELLVEGLGLRAAVVRTASGDLIGAAGGILHAVPSTRGRPGSTSSVELPVPGRSSAPQAHLTVIGARPSQLPVLRAVAAVVGLALAPERGPTHELLLDELEQEHDELADALHDGPVQALVAARWAADAALRGGDPMAAREAIQEALVALRRTLWQLRPRGRDGLGAALEALSDRVTEAGGPAPTIRGANGPAGRTGGTAAIAAYRLVQAVARPGFPTASIDVHLQDGALVVLLDGGAPLLDPSRWTARARALGGDLWTRTGRLRLDLPTLDPRNAL